MFNICVILILNLTPEQKERLFTVFKTTMRKAFNDSKVQINEYHLKHDLYRKIDNLKELINNCEKDKDSNQDLPWRFYDDSNKTINSMTIESKRNLVKNLSDIEDRYDSLIQSYEKQLDGNFNELIKQLKPVINFTQ